MASRRSGPAPHLGTVRDDVESHERRRLEVGGNCCEQPDHGFPPSQSESGAPLPEVPLAGSRYMTMTVPSVSGCVVQWYTNVPAVSKVWLRHSPCPSEPVSKNGSPVAGSMWVAVAV